MPALREFQRLSERVELLEKHLPPKATPTESTNVSFFNARVYGLERELGSLKNAVAVLGAEARSQKARWEKVVPALQADGLLKAELQKWRSG